MPQQPRPSVENNFVEGLKTEFTGLNFPENACTNAENCVFTLIGDVQRRLGIDFEFNYNSRIIDRTNSAVSSYIWTNVGGDGQTKIYVLQVGAFLYFYQLTNARVDSPLSATILTTVIPIRAFIAAGSSAIVNDIECQYADGNGFLFVFHPNCDPFYCQFINGVISTGTISIQVRDLSGIFEPGVPDNSRPTTLTADHKYNLINQGWTQGAGWFSNVVSIVPGVGQSGSVQVASGLTALTGDSFALNGVDVNGVHFSSTGTVVSYSGTTLIINILNYTPISEGGAGITSAVVFSINSGLINTWFSAVNNYPSNADIWWEFKNSAGVFAPSTTIGNVILGNAPAPKGFVIFSAFNQFRAGPSGVSIPTLSTPIRPKTGCWFQGRVFYAGADASTSILPEFPYYTWTENIYFSQIIEGTRTDQFAKCYQVNDPTDDRLFNLLPSDGGVITIQGSGSIYKLFSVQNGLLVFAANGIWFITGSQGIGFSATDYTITKISNVRSISSTSHINVLGYPIFWNEEGIYGVAPAQTGALTVNNLCLGTILSFYNEIPLQSKKFVRGDYDPISFQVKWVYRSTNESSITDRYQFDSVLNFNTVHKSFYPYSLPNGSSPNIHDVKYVESPGGTGSPFPIMKYLTSFISTGNYLFTFSEERDETYVDWQAQMGGIPFVSTFTTGYKVHGNALTKFQPQWTYVYMRQPSSYTINAIWDFANNPNSGKYSVRQKTTNYLFPTRDYLYRRHRLRGRGIALQLEFTSIPNQPFDLIGWAIFSQVNMRP